jgi:2-methylcitrate dehydratase PrpD
LAAYAASLRPEHLSAAALAQAKLLAFDQIGVALFVAHRTPWGAIVTGLAVDELQGAPQATVVGTGARTSCPAAALANGTLAMGFEYEDMHPTSGGHPYAIAFPAALAVGQWQRRSGLEVLTAAAAGYEIETRIGLGLRVETAKWVERGMYPITMLGVFGAAAAAARAMRLSAEQTAHALGIAGSHAFGTMQAHAEGTMTRRLHGGKAAEVGVTAALLAARGFTGPTRVLEGEFGFFRTYARRYDLHAVTANLGAPMMIEDAWLKCYPVNGLFQAPIDAVRALRSAHGFTRRDVAGIKATIAKASRMHAERVHTSAVRAQFSLPVSLALTLRDGRPSPTSMLAPIDDPEVIDLAQRIDVTLNPEVPPGHPDATRYGHVEVTLRDGRVLAETVLYPKGHPKNPMTWADVREKVDDLLDGWVPPRRRETLAGDLARFDELPDVSALDLSVAPARPS